MKIRSLIFAFLCFAGQYATAHSVDYSTTLLRKWHMVAEHKTLEGSFYLCKNGNVFVEDARNQVVQFPLVDLSKEDQAYVAETLARIEQLQANPTPSPFRAEESPVNENSKWLMVSGLLALFLVLLLVMIEKSKRKYLLPLFPVGLVFILVGFKSKVFQNTQMATNPIAMDSAFVPFKPDVYTRWDATYFYVESKGLPKHEMMTGITGWQQQAPIPQCYTGTNAWSIPLNPVIAAVPVPVNTQHFLRGAVAVAVNGIAIFNPFTNTGVDAFLDGQLDHWGGHCGRADDYHYHTAPLHLYSQTVNTMPIAYALDGFPIFGAFEPDGSAMTTLDANHGHLWSNGVYHYHGTATAPYMIGNMVGKVTEDATMQIIPQAAARGVRPSGTPLQGAVITGCVPNGTNNGYLLTYTKGGQNYSWNYFWNAADQYTFQYITPTGTTTTNYNGHGICVLPTEAQQNIVADPKVELFPNPGQDGFFITLGDAKQAQSVKDVRVYSLTGNLVYQTNQVASKISIAGLKQGIYLVKIQLPGQTITKKWTVQ